MPGSSEGGVPPSGRFYKGAGPLVGVGCDGREAYLKQYVDRPSGELARRQACHSGVSAVAVEAFVNNAGLREGCLLKAGFGLEQLDHVVQSVLMRGSYRQKL